MASVNKVILIGNLGADPELRYTPNGAAVCNFSLATTDSRTDREGNRQEFTEWHRIVVWNKQAENCSKYLSKGRPAYIEGRLQTRSWEDKNSGQKRYTTEIVADRVQFLGGRGDSQASSADSYGQPAGGGNYRQQQPQHQQQQQQQQSEPFAGAPDLEDIPF